MDKEKLLKQATAIRDAHMIAENTAVRVGSLFVDIVNALMDGKSFLSRIREDSALKRITFLAGLTMMGGAIASADGSEKIDFEYDTVNKALHFKGNVYADGFITAKGKSSIPGGGSGSSYSRYDGDWSDFVPSMHDKWAVSGKSGMLLHERIKALEDGMPTPHTLTIKRNGTTVGTFDNSSDKTVDIADVASATTLSSHMSDAAVHVTATERARWDKTASDLSAITGTDADTVINKWEEVVAFLANYTEADTLASLLSHKADKATTLAGYGITDGVNDAKVTGSGNAVTSASVSGHMLTLAKDATFLEKSLFDEMFEKVNTGTASAPVWAIRAKYALYSDSWISAKGRNPGMPGGGSGGSGFGLMRTWPSDVSGVSAMDALGANLGWELYTTKADNTALSSAVSRITALEGKNYLDALTLVQSGSGNAVTSVAQSADKKTIAVTKGASFLGATATAVNSNALTAINDEHTDLDILGATANCLRHYYGGGGAVNPNKPSGVAQYGLLNLRSAVGHITQLLTSNGVFHSRWYSGSAWQPWRTFLDSGNYSSILDGRYYTKTEVDAKNFIKDAGDGRTLKFNYSAAAMGYGDFTWVAAWNGNTLQGVNKNVFATATALTNGLSGKVDKSGDTMTGPLTIQGINDAKLIFNNTDGEKFTEISFRENGTEYLALYGQEDRLIVTKYVQAPYFKATSSTLCPNLNADLLDGHHLGFANGDAMRIAPFPGYSTLISTGYLDSSYGSEGHPNDKYFKALLKWMIASYPNGGTFVGDAIPSSHGVCHIFLYGSGTGSNGTGGTAGGADPGLPRYCTGVYYSLLGEYREFHTYNGVWHWGKATFHGSLSGNASTATRLQGTFKLWGQDFYGNDVSGNMTGVGSISASGEIKTASANGLRAVQGGYGFFMRNDGTNSFLLLTDKNNADGIWNAMRPLTIANATGNVGIGGNALYVVHGSRVGIKTTSPAYDLDVNGTARATSLTLGGGTISWDADAQMFKFSHGLYSEGAVTAKGKSSIPGGGGSGTGYSRLDAWADYTGDKAGWVLSAKLGNELNNRLLNAYTKTAVDSMLGAKADSTAVVTALGTSGNSLTWTKNGATNNITVPYASRSGYADVLRDPVYHDYPHRRTSANVNFNNDCGVHTFLATSTMTTGKPSGDAHILHMEWDNALSWAAQIAVPTNASDGIQWRVQGNPEWQTWIRILDENNYSSILDGRYYTESEINSKLSGYVTLNTVQSIKGAKTFESVVKIAPTNVSGYQDGLVLHDNGSGNGEALRIRWTSFSYSDGITLTPTMNANRLTSSADLYAPKFIKDGSSDSYLLLGGGGHKALSDLATASALSSGLSGKVDKSGDSMTGALSIKSGAYNKTLELMSTGADSKGKGAGIRFRGSDTDISQGVTLRHEWYDTFVPGYGLAISHEGSLEAGDASMWLYNTGRYISKVPTGTKPIDVVSTTLCTNLNADMLDGVHNGSVTANRLNFFFEKSSSTADASNLAIIKEHYTSIPAQQACAIGLRHGSLSMAFGWKLGESYNSIDKAYCGWFVSNYGTPGWIGADNGVWKSETFAFLSSNVASATKLADDTAFTAWGQKFFENGKPKNLSGNLTDVGHIYLNSGKYLYAPDADGTQRTLIDFYSGQKPTFAYGFASVGTDVEYCGNNIYLSYGMTHVKGFVLNASGNVGIGKPDPAYRVDVNGDIRTSGQLRLGTWGRMLYDGGGWLQMAPNATNRITAMNDADMARLEIKAAVSHFSGQISNSNSAGNGTTIAYGAIELIHATPYIDFHFGRSTEDFDMRIINDEAGVLHLHGASSTALRLGNGYIRWDSSKGCFAFSHGIYSESFITAKEKNKQATASESSDKEAGGILKTASADSSDGHADDDEMEQLRQRVAYLEQRLNALTA